MSIDMKKTHRQINIHLARLPKHYIPTAHDEEDLRQEIVCEILLLYDHHDRALAARPTYCDRIIRKQVGKYKSRKRWLKHQSHESLHDLEDEDQPLTNVVRTGELDCVQQRVFESELRDAVTRLPDDLRNCCELLKYFSPSETARLMNVSPATVWRKTRSLKSHLSRAGFQPGE